MKKHELHPRTAVINQKQKNLSRKARLDALRWLAETFPKAFDNSIRIRPLSLGIMQDILNHPAAIGQSKSKLRQAVVLFTRRIDYLICLKSREMRINLEGEVVSQVTEEEASLAVVKIKKHVEKSAKIARKNLMQSVVVSKSNQPVQEPSPVFSERLQDYNPQQTSSSSAKNASVVITHRQNRQYDPDAVARLKEKLGLSRKKTETTEL